mmetsp:Transcript_7584/g.11480  ORF Transcript_7584/g.11480 Transcript_7584/m.11480 type:complete len:238 (+) Transcript_7584:201-914(+)|eukprot:CAMPEP_0167743732 /NCGR_PEP_ID=MMETSP0110_2-20121227/2177_1 /TAXON_ID=629695 /ORGANISM="Gymnochlora sp., Strain CCMP2014" /LENGTH=237 /DNA_ID=CAMNT_0007628131 /DNA_START=143 /DNA_END=856 /DNA_ORIENTATION=-
MEDVILCLDLIPSFEKKYDFSRFTTPEDAKSLQNSWVISSAATFLAAKCEVDPKCRIGIIEASQTEKWVIKPREFSSGSEAVTVFSDIANSMAKADAKQKDLDICSLFKSIAPYTRSGKKMRLVMFWARNTIPIKHSYFDSLSRSMVEEVMSFFTRDGGLCVDSVCVLSRDKIESQRIVNGLIGIDASDMGRVYSIQAQEKSQVCTEYLMTAIGHLLYPGYTGKSRMKRVRGLFGEL